VPDDHQPFLDLFLLYADFNRPLLLETFLESFLASASPSELKTLRRAIHDRAIALRQSRKKGRPRAEKSWAWICSALRLVWRREIDGWSWPRLAAAAGLKPTKPNIRTLRNRYNHYTALIAQTLQRLNPAPEALNKLLDAEPIQRLLQSKLALPFDTHPQECKRLVLKLLPRGLEINSKVP